LVKGELPLVFLDDLFFGLGLIKKTTITSNKNIVSMPHTGGLLPN